MADKTMPITKAQCDIIDNLVHQRNAVTERLNVILNAIVAGTIDGFAGDVAFRTECKDGVYSLTVVVPDVPRAIPPTQRRPSAPRKRRR